MVELERSQMTIWRLVASWISKATREKAHDCARKHARARTHKYHSIIWRTLFACRITKTKKTHSEYVILIAFLRQKWFRQRASLLRHTYFFCLVTHFVHNPSAFLIPVAQFVESICPFSVRNWNSSFYKV